MMNNLQSTAYGDFAADYKSNHLIDICETKDGVQTGPFGSQLHKEDYVPVGTPIITVEHLGENRILHSDIPRVSEDDLERLSKYTLLKGDIVFSRVGSVDRRALVRDEEDGWLFSGRCLRVRPNQSIIDPGYLSYFFGLPSFKEYIRAVAVGATMPSLNTKILSDVIIYYPNLPEQRAIAHILGTLDDKIDLNRRMNETLEAMARAIFKSWFVDFDPVRAKAEGQDTGLPKEIADLFPDSFEETELGEVPKGWRVGSVSELATINCESWTKDNSPDIVKYVDLSNVKEGNIISVQEFEFSEAPSRARRVLRDGDTIIGTVRPGNKSFAYIQEDGLTGSTGFAVLRALNLYSKEFIYLYLTREEAIEFFTHIADGAAYPAIRPEIISEYKMVIPHPDMLKMFSIQVSPMLQKIHINNSQNLNLTEVRDYLLPELMSGQIRVSTRDQ